MPGSCCLHCCCGYFCLSTLPHSAALPLLSSFHFFSPTWHYILHFFPFYSLHLSLHPFFNLTMIKAEGYYIKSHMLSHLFFMHCWCSESWEKWLVVRHCRKWMWRSAIDRTWWKTGLDMSIFLNSNNMTHKLSDERGVLLNIRNTWRELFALTNVYGCGSFSTSSQSIFKITHRKKTQAHLTIF